LYPFIQRILRLTGASSDDYWKIAKNRKKSTVKGQTAGKGLSVCSFFREKLLAAGGKCS
jgi:hypothetical protein